MKIINRNTAVNIKYFALCLIKRKYRQSMKKNASITFDECTWSIFSIQNMANIALILKLQVGQK